MKSTPPGVVIRKERESRNEKDDTEVNFGIVSSIGNSPGLDWSDLTCPGLGELFRQVFRVFPGLGLEYLVVRLCL